MTYVQGSQFGYLNPDRITITPIDAFADGSTTQDGVPVDTRVNLHGIVNTGSVYATDTLFRRQVFGVHAFGAVQPHLRRQYRSTSTRPHGGAGLIKWWSMSSNGSIRPREWLIRPSHFATFYFNYSEANRAPTSIELGCADPSEPCNLPNALVSDPPLKQVVTRTFETGVRGSREANLRWNFDWFLRRELQRSPVRCLGTNRLRLFHEFRPNAAGRR